MTDLTKTSNKFNMLRKIKIIKINLQVDYLEADDLHLQGANLLFLVYLLCCTNCFEIVQDQKNSENQQPYHSV